MNKHAIVNVGTLMLYCAAYARIAEQYIYETPKGEEAEKLHDLFWASRDEADYLFRQYFRPANPRLSWHRPRGKR